MRTLDPRDAVGVHWDAIVVGTGMGGATFGYGLAKVGLRVLFVEKGLASGSKLTGDYAERFLAVPEHQASTNAEVLLRAGRFGQAVEDHSKARSQVFVPFIGSGPGGSSALYGMAMERLHRSDFGPRQSHSKASEANLPSDWPFSYDELVPFYAAAERLYGVRGGMDPLRQDPIAIAAAPAPQLTPPVRALAAHFASRGLHPYRLPIACESVPDCDSCQGYLCAKNCKNDAARICLEPAIVDHGASLVDRCDVVRVKMVNGTAREVECRLGKDTVALRGRLVALAAGALMTPAILLRSEEAVDAGTTINGSGMIGRNLMRHLVDLYAIRPSTIDGFDNRGKEIAFNDFYLHDGAKLGGVQSFGRLPPIEVVMEALAHDVRRGRIPWVAPLIAFASPALRPFLKYIVERCLTLASTVEDLPYAGNRVELSRGAANAIAMRYTVHRYERDHLRLMRRLMGKALSPLRYWLIKQAENNERVAHACGTCRAGIDSKTSVVDAQCRVHGVGNLYVVDASWFPTSGGTNPSLTIAANALRVVDSIAGRSGGR